MADQHRENSAGKATISRLARHSFHVAFARSES